MGLTYQELLNKIENLVEEKFNAKFDQLSAELSEVKRTNGHLIELNKSLIALNKQLRASSDEDGSNPSAVFAADEIPTPAVDAPPGQPNRRQFADVLILSDSIFRHVVSECPKEQDNKKSLIPVISNFSIGSATIIKAVCPGARCENLLSAAARLSTSHSFDHVIVSVGANYFSASRNGRVAPSPADTAGDIQNFLVAIGDLFDARVTFSAILPQGDIRLIDDINYINTSISAFCEEYGLNFLQCLRFKRRYGKLDLSLLARDGVHLSRSGTEFLWHCVRNRIMYDLSYMD